MARHINTYLIPVASIFMAFSSSCIYESLPPCPGDKVQLAIVNDWRHAPGASPEGMAYLFFRRGLESPWRFDFPGREAGKILLAPGEYSFVMYNNDTSRAIFTAGDGGLPFVTTKRSIVGTGDGDIKVNGSPDMMWAWAIDRLEVTPAGVEYTPGEGDPQRRGDWEIVTAPRQITPVYTVSVLHVDNLSGVAAMKGMITGMASGYDLGRMSGSDVAVTVAFDPATNPDSTVTAVFTNFGLPSRNRTGNELRLYFLLSDGRMICSRHDVTGIVESAPDPLNVEIVIDSIQLPYAPPAGQGGAFDPSVTGWKTVIVNYET